jgi:hypothetical protein
MLVIHGVLFQGLGRYATLALSLAGKEDILDSLSIVMSLSVTYDRHTIFHGTTNLSLQLREKEL